MSSRLTIIDIFQLPQILWQTIATKLLLYFFTIRNEEETVQNVRIA